MKKFLILVAMATLAASCAVESRFGQVKESSLSGCNTDRSDAPARVASKVMSSEDYDRLASSIFVHVVAQDDGSYFVLVQDLVNCCAASVDAHLYIGDNGELNFCFEERSGIASCDCICPLRCEATLTGMEEGEYPVNIYHNRKLQYQTTVTLSSGIDDITKLN